MWKVTQNGITYIRSIVDGEPHLLVKKGDSSALVKDWSGGELAIVLGASVPLAPSATPLTGTAYGNYPDAADTGSRNVEGQAGTTSSPQPSPKASVFSTSATPISPASPPTSSGPTPSAALA
jgi:hypothetical protein